MTTPPSIGSTFSPVSDDDIRSAARDAVHPGFNDRMEAEQAVRDVLELDDDPRVASILDEVWQARLAEQQTWTRPGEYARIAAAFEELGSHGVLARMAFTCCQTCGTDEIDDERTPRPDAREGEYRYEEWAYTFFHQQDADRLAEQPAVLYLTFSAFRRADDVPEELVARSNAGDEEAKDAIRVWTDSRVGHEVAQALVRHGLDVRWGGNPEHRIEVFITDWRKPLPDAGGAPEAEPARLAPLLDEGDVEDDEDLEDDEDFGVESAWFVAVLLSEPFWRLGDALRHVDPSLADRLDAEGVTSHTVESGGVRVDIDLHPAFDDDADLVETAHLVDDLTVQQNVAQHRAVLLVSAFGDEPVQARVQAVRSVVLALSAGPAATAVWAPHQVSVVMPAMYATETHRAWFSTLVTDVADGVVALTRGLSVLDLPEVQVTGVEDEDELEATVTACALKVVDVGTAPPPGMTLTLAGRDYAVGRGSLLEGDDQETVLLTARRANR